VLPCTNRAELGTKRRPMRGSFVPRIRESRLAVVLAMVTGLCASDCGNATPSVHSARAAPSPSEAFPVSSPGTSSPQPPAPRPPAVESLHLVATTNGGDIRLHRLENELLFEINQSVARMVDGRLVVDDRLSRGLPREPQGGLVNLVGWWPDRVIAVTSTMGRQRVISFRDGSWKPVDRIPPSPGYDYWGASVLGHDSIAGLFFSYEPQGGPALRFAWMVGAGTLPELDMPPGDKCAAYVTPLGFLGFETGHVVVTGPRCGDGKPAVTAWSPKGGRGSTYVWEDIPGRVQSRAEVVGRSADDLFVAWQMTEPVGTRIAHFDGKALKPIDAPAASVESFALDPSGSLWLASPEGLFCKHPEDQSFAPVTVVGRQSKSRYVDSVVALHGKVWAAAFGELYGSQPPSDGVQHFEP